MEMNTRLQVEHPVTEEVLGIDLVELQLRVASGEALPWSGTEGLPRPRGHAVEARVYAEDPQRGFLPSAGTVRVLHEPVATRHVRVDSGLAPGTVVGTSFDPLLSKIIAWGEDRASALKRLRAALDKTVVIGLTTNVGFLRRLVSLPEVVSGEIDTTLVDRVADKLHADPAPLEVVAAAAMLDGLLRRQGPQAADPWDVADGWRLTGPAPLGSRWRIGGTEMEAVVHDGAVSMSGARPVAACAQITGRDVLDVVWAGSAARYVWTVEGDTTWLARGGDVWELARQWETIDRTGSSSTDEGPLTSPMPGTVLAVHVAADDAVQAGQPVVSVEAMKMEHVVVARSAGTVRKVLVAVGDSVALDQPLAVIEATGATSGADAGPTAGHRGSGADDS
jgi:acetyl-CoA/propionyl-CoA carboxylase, biotin carboxylase, biotin carboxyl carrier protein